MDTLFLIHFDLRYFAPPDSFPIRVKSGRYIEMTIPPMVTPRKAMRTGSINASTAVAEFYASLPLKASRDCVRARDSFRDECSNYLSVASGGTISIQN